MKQEEILTGLTSTAILPTSTLEDLRQSNEARRITYLFNFSMNEGKYVVNCIE